MIERGNNPIDWEIDYISNNVQCDICGKQEKCFPQYICDAHTHGMDRYGHMEFQLFLDYGPEEISRLLNTMGLRVQQGETFHDGDFVEGLYLDCDIQLRKVTDIMGIPVLRLMIPDKWNRMPIESEPPFVYQMLATSLLYQNTEHHR